MTLTNRYFWQEVEQLSLSRVLYIVYDGLLTGVSCSIELLFKYVVLL